MRAAATAWLRWIPTTTIQFLPRALRMIRHGCPSEDRRSHNPVVRTGWRAWGLVEAVADGTLGLIESAAGVLGTAYAGLVSLGGRRPAAIPPRGFIVGVGLLVELIALATAAPLGLLLGGFLLAATSGDLHDSAVHAGKILEAARASRLAARGSTTLATGAPATTMARDATGIDLTGRVQQGAPPLTIPEQRQRGGHALGE